MGVLMYKHSILLISIITLLNIYCRGPEGPAGPPGSASQSLTDPSIKPEIIATHPPANSVGPYEDFSDKEIQIRFNKIMDRSSIKRAVSLSSNKQKLQIDTSTVHSIGGDVFTFYPVDTNGQRNFFWKINELDTLKISTSAVDINGNYLSSSYVMTFKPEPEFRVVNVYPTDGSIGIRPDTSITLIFNSPVNQTIFSQIDIQPVVSGQWKILNPSTINFKPDTSFRTNTKYKIIVARFANDIYGNLLQKEFVSYFTTSNFFVILTSPSADSKNVSLYQTISVRFNSPIKISSVSSAFKISPQLLGHFDLFEEHSVFTFVPEPELAAETTYNVIIDTTLESLRGDKLSEPYQFSFTSGKLQVIFTSPYDGATNINRFLNRLEMYFNARLDTGSVKEAFNNGGIEGQLQTSPNGEYFYYYITGAPLHSNTTYTVGVSTALRTRGGTYLKSPYYFSFTTAK